MTEFENIFEEANKKNGKEAPPPKPAPEATEKKSFADKMREKKLKCYEMIDEGCASIVANAENMQQFLDVQSRCENYSLSNNILIYMQMDDKLPYASRRPRCKDSALRSKCFPRLSARSSSPFSNRRSP